MPKLEAAIAGALALLLSACGQESASAGNRAAAAGDNSASAQNAIADPAQQPDPANSSGEASTGEAVPPPDAVSHPNGYLPPAPAEGQTPLANSTDADKVPPATEDQYMRNGQ